MTLFFKKVDPLGVKWHFLFEIHSKKALFHENRFLVRFTPTKSKNKVIFGILVKFYVGIGGSKI